MAVTRKQLTPEVVERLQLEYEVGFDYKHALRLVWAVICFALSIVCLVQGTLGWTLTGSALSTLLILNLMGQPFVAVLDAASSKRLEAWERSED